MSRYSRLFVVSFRYYAKCDGSIVFDVIILLPFIKHTCDAEIDWKIEKMRRTSIDSIWSNLCISACIRKWLCVCWELHHSNAGKLSSKIDNFQLVEIANINRLIITLLWNWSIMIIKCIVPIWQNTQHAHTKCGCLDFDKHSTLQPHAFPNTDENDFSSNL